MYDFLSHRSLNECNTPPIGDTETPHTDPPPVSVLKRKENSLMSAKSKAKTPRRHTGALVSGKEMTSSPVLQSLVNFSQSRRPKRAQTCCVCEYTAPPVSSPGTAVNWVACDGEGCDHFCHAAICVPHQVTDNAQFFCPCHDDGLYHLFIY